MSLCQSPTCPRVTQSHTPQSNLHKTIFVNLVSPNPLTKLPASYCLVREKGSGRNILFWSTNLCRIQNVFGALYFQSQKYVLVRDNAS